MKEIPTQMLPIGLIEPNKGQIEGLPKNPRLIRDEHFKKLKKSIEDNPEMLYLRELLVYPHQGKYVVIGGNMRLMAMRDLKYTEAPCKVIPEDTTVEQLKAYTIKDNAAYGEWDYDLLANEWDEVQLDDWCLDIPDTKAVNPTAEAHEDDFDPDAHYETKVKAGEVWQLGEHRLMCGDSTDADAVAKLMNGERADLSLTDPPYGVAVVQNGTIVGDKPFGKGTVGGDNVVKANQYAPIIGDETTETARKSYDVMKAVSANQIIFGGNYFTDFLQPKACWLVWDKENTGNFADVELAWTSFDKGAKLYRWQWNGMVRKGDRETELVKRVHPTQKPVGMLGAIIQDFTKDGAVILDLFGGSGSTLIAAEQLNRKCYMMELDPHYCDVIIARWEQFTGQKAKLLTNTKTAET